MGPHWCCVYSKKLQESAGGGIRTHEPLRDGTLNPAPLTNSATPAFVGVNLLGYSMFRPSLLQLDFNSVKVELVLKLNIMSRKCIFNGCNRDALENSDYCVLHEDYKSSSYDEVYLTKEKVKILHEEIKSGEGILKVVFFLKYL